MPIRPIRPIRTRPWQQPSPPLPPLPRSFQPRSCWLPVWQRTRCPQVGPGPLRAGRPTAPARSRRFSVQTYPSPRDQATTHRTASSSPFLFFSFPPPSEQARQNNNKASHGDQFRIDDTTTFHHTIEHGAFGAFGAFGACRPGTQEHEPLPTPATGTTTTCTAHVCRPHPEHLAPPAAPRCHRRLARRDIVPARGPTRPSHRYASFSPAVTPS